ncbi:hypothetical protein JCM8547_004504 [Rhodosporidiobolus lusitaniae]
MDKPLAGLRDGVAPRHRPPLLPALPTTPANLLLAEPLLPSSPAAHEQHAQPQRRRRRAGSNAKSARAKSASPPAAGLGGGATGGGAGREGNSASGVMSPVLEMGQLGQLGQSGQDAQAIQQPPHRRPSAQSPPAQSSLPPLPNSSLLAFAPPAPPPATAAPHQLSPAVSRSATPVASPAAPSTAYRPASAKPPMSRIPTFPLVDAYVPDTNSTDRRHPRQLVPKDLGFPTVDMHGKIRKEDLDDRLLMATCAVLHRFENRALCPKEVAEVMLERDWLKNAGTTPFAHVSTCIRSHIARAAGASPPYLPLLTPFELVGALTAEEVRAVGLHAEQRPAVKRGTLWYLNPQVFGSGVGADDPFVRCRREAGLAPSDRAGLYVRGLVPLQAAQPNLPPDLKMSSSIFHSEGADDEGDEVGMGRGKRKRRASSAMMAAMSTTPATPSPLSASVGASSASPLPIPAARPGVPSGALAGPNRRALSSFAGPSSAPARSSGIPKLKLRLTALEEVDSGVDDSDGHTGEAAERRKKNKKKVRRAGSEGLSRAGSVEPSSIGSDEDDDLLGQSFSSLPAAFSTMSSSALLAQSLLAASSPGAVLPRSQSHTALATTNAISPDSLSLSLSGVNSFPFARPTSHSAPLNLSMSAPNIFSHHFANAPSPPDVMDLDPDSSSSRPPLFSSVVDPTTLPVLDAVSPPSTDEDDFHEAMLRGDDLLDFEWGSESYTSTAGTSSIEASSTVPPLPFASSTPLLKQVELPLEGIEEGEKKHKGKVRAISPVPSVATVGTAENDAAQAEIDTPATTPRSPGKEYEEVLPAAAPDVGENTMTEDGVDAEKNEEVKEEPMEIVQGPLGQISRVGMSTTLCGAMKEAQVVDVDAEEDVVIVVENDEADDVELSVASVSLTSLGYDTPPSAKHSPRGDSAHLTAPPPSPLPLEFTSMGALTNAFAATDFDFVGHDEHDRSPFFRGSSFSQDDGDSADNEEEEDDDIITVKIEEDDHHLSLSSAPSSRASSAYSPAPQFDSRLLAGSGVRAGSTGSSSSDDSFDPMTFVSTPMLATGLPVPQSAPSPPDESAEWSHSIDMLDDLETELAGVDLMAPEAIGLDELDLAWAGDEEEHPPSPSSSTPSKLRVSIPRSGSAAFLTGSTFSSPQRFTSPMPSPRRTSSTRVPVLADFGKKGGATPVPPALTRTSSGTTIFSGSGAPTPRYTPKPQSSSENIEPVVPLDPAVVATIAQRGIVVFSVSLPDYSSSSTTFPLLRRLDNDYCNATSLFRAALPASDRFSALSSLLASSPSSTFSVPSSSSFSSDSGTSGVWIPLSLARQLAASYPSKLSHLSVFLSDDLPSRFPEPVGAMRASLVIALDGLSGQANVLGAPAFEGAEVVRANSTVPDSADEAEVVSAEEVVGAPEQQEEAQEKQQPQPQKGEAGTTPPPPRRTGRTRRPTAVKVEMDSSPRRAGRR